jgi:dihydroneopterin aldolase
MDRVFIENYTLIAKHGYYKEEHYKPQRFVVSVYADVMNNSSGQSDALADTFNYEVIRKVVSEVIMGAHHDLLESLAEEIASKVLTNKIVNKVEVKITKPDIWGDCNPGVQIVRVK